MGNEGKKIVIMVKMFKTLGVILLLLSSCAYYNTFYNAEQYFKEAVESYNKQQDKSKVDFKLRKQFNAAIEKSNKVLLKYPDSKWSDDALFIIAVSNYYKGNYQTAKNKFDEFLLKYPSSPLRTELEIWLGRNYWKMGKENQAIFQWKKTAKKAKKPELRSEIYFALAELFMKKHEIDSSLVYYEKIANLKGIDRAAEAQFRIAEIYLEKSDIDNAIVCLKKVSRLSPSVFLKGQIEVLLTKIYRESGRYDEAIDLINKKLNEESNKDIWAELELQLALIYKEQEDFKTAEARFVLITEKYPKTPISAEAYYHLAMLNMIEFHDYQKAKDFFDKVKSEDNSSKFVFESQQKSLEIKRYFSIKDKLTPLMKQTSEIKAFLLEKEVVEEDTTDASGTAEELKKSVENEMAASKKSIDTVGVFKKYYQKLYELSELHYFNFQLLDSSVACLETIAHSQLYNPFIEKSLYALYFIYKRENNEELSNFYLDVLDKEFPSSTYLSFIRGDDTKLTSEENEARELYLTAEKYFENSPDSAIIILEQLNNKYPDILLGEKAAFCISWLYHNKLYDLDNTMHGYEKFIENYPESEFLTVVKKKYNELKSVLSEEEAKKDTVNISEQSDTLNVSAEIDTLIVQEEPVKPKKVESDTTNIEQKIKEFEELRKKVHPDSLLLGEPKKRNIEK